MHDVSRAVVQVLVIATWLLTMFAFVGGKAKSGKADATRRRDSVSRLGIFVQGIAFALSWVGPWWMFMRSSHKPRLPLWVAVVAVVLGIAGAMLVVKSVRTLGREWSLTARVLEGHRLVTSGPYAIVRNPIYTGMWGLQLATAIAFSSWIWWGLLPIAAAIYYLGTLIRVRREEKLLREEFGAEFDEYARRVPAIISWLLTSRPAKTSGAK
jgi:protein-S-isoprenylcysteine O-methyltransferase Ste14